MNRESFAALLERHGMPEEVVCAARQLYSFEDHFVDALAKGKLLSDMPDIAIGNFEKRTIGRGRVELRLNGIQRYVVTIRGDKFNGPYLQYDEHERLRTQCLMKNDEMDGLVRDWLYFISDVPAHVRESWYVCGRKHGTSILWSRNGVKVKSIFVDDKLVELWSQSPEHGDTWHQAHWLDND